MSIPPWVVLLGLAAGAGVVVLATQSYDEKEGYGKDYGTGKVGGNYRLAVVANQRCGTCTFAGPKADGYEGTGEGDLYCSYWKTAVATTYVCDMWQEGFAEEVDLQDFGWVEPQLVALADMANRTRPILRSVASDSLSRNGFEARYTLYEDQANDFWIGAINWRMENGPSGRAFAEASADQEQAQGNLDAKLEELFESAGSETRPLPKPPPPGPENAPDQSSAELEPWTEVESEFDEPYDLIAISEVSQQIDEGQLLADLRAYRVGTFPYGAVQAYVVKNGQREIITAVTEAVPTYEEAIAQALDLAAAIRDQEFPEAQGTDPDFVSEITWIDESYAPKKARLAQPKKATLKEF